MGIEYRVKILSKSVAIRPGEKRQRPPSFGHIVTMHHLLTG